MLPPTSTFTLAVAPALIVVSWLIAEPVSIAAVLLYSVPVSVDVDAVLLEHAANASKEIDARAKSFLLIQNEEGDKTGGHYSS